MQRRARALAGRAIEQNQVWVRRLGVPPSDPLGRERWTEAVTTVAAYRKRWGIDDDSQPLGSKGTARTIEAIKQRERARGAVNRASRLTQAAGAQCQEIEGVAVAISPAGEVELQR
jgi:hypothetical protein